MAADLQGNRDGLILPLAAGSAREGRVRQIRRMRRDCRPHRREQISVLTNGFDMVQVWKVFCWIFFGFHSVS